MANPVSFADVENLSQSFGGIQGVTTPTFSPGEFSFNPFGAATSVLGLPGPSPFSYQGPTANVAGQSIELGGGFFGQGGTNTPGSVGGNFDNPTFGAPDGNVGGMTILDDGTQVNAQGVAISGPRAGQRFIPGTQQPASLDGRQDPRFNMLGPTNTGFSPQNPNQPVSFGGNTLAPLTVQTPAGTVSRDAQGNFGFDSGIGELRSKRAAAFAAAADDIDKQAQQYDTAPLTQARMKRFDNAVNDLGLRQEAAKGNLRQQLSRRRVLGSSFANDEMNRQTSDFEDQRNELTSQRAEVEAESILQEFGVKTQLITQANKLRVQAAQEEIQAVFGESEIANNMITALAALAQESMNIKMQIAAQEAQSIRDNITRNKAIESSVNSAQQIAAADREQQRGIGIGSLFGTVLSAPTKSIGGSILGRIFGK